MLKVTHRTLAVVTVSLGIYLFRQWLKWRKDRDVRGKTVLIADAQAGESAHRFAADGAARIILWHTDTKFLDTMTKELLAAYEGLKVNIARVDISDAKSIERAKKNLRDPVHTILGESLVHEVFRLNTVTMEV